VKPGDTILVHAGVYKDRRFSYGGQSGDRAGASYGTSFDGTYYLTAKGTADKPIVIKAAGDGEVIFDGDGNDTLFNLLAGDYHYFDGITVRNTNVAFLLGIKDIIGATGFTLVNSRFYNIGRGVRQDWHKSQDFYIADNVLWHGRVAVERYVDIVPGWTEAILEHNTLIFNDPEFDAFINPTRDGVIVARKKTTQ